LFSIAPAWRSARADALTGLRRRAGASSARNPIGRPMVAAQVALAVVAVFGAAVATRTFAAVLNAPLGFSSTGVLRLTMSPPRDIDDRKTFYRRALDALRQRSDVQSAGAVGAMPLSGRGPDDSVGSSDGGRVGAIHVLPGYFETMAIGLRR